MLRMWIATRSHVLALALALCTSASGCTGDVAATPSYRSAAGSGSISNPAAPFGAAASAGNSASAVPPGAPGSTAAASCTPANADTAPSVLRRLSNLEYQLSVQDLFQLATPPSTDSLPPDVDKDGFRTFAALQTVSAQHLRAYIERAHTLASDLLADNARRGRVVGCEPAAQGCLRTFVTRFGKLAYRRPLEATEIDAIVRRAGTDALDATDQFRFAIELLLSSSSFLYRVEVGASADPLATLAPYELASRLSFLVWGRGPDAALLDRAAGGALSTPDGLLATAAAMLADDRARVFFDGFFGQWLGYEGMQAPPNPPSGWTEALLVEMSRETQLVVDDFAWSKRNFLDVLIANYTRPTRALAAYYALPAAAGDGTATFPAGHARANTGVLTHPSVLSAKRDGDLIAIRGNWLRRTFLCRSLSIPPEVAETLGDMLAGLTRQQIVKKRNSEAACRGCHGMIDPIGVSFVQFDATGRSGVRMAASDYGIAPALPDAPTNPTFASLGELALKLHDLPEVSSCLAAKAFIYTNGREPEAADACALQTASAAFVQSNNSFAELVQGLVAAPSFRLRRAPGAMP